MRVFDVSADMSTTGETVIADVRSGTGSGVALVEPSGHSTLLRADDGGTQGQAGGGYDGRFAVWKDYPTPANLDLFTVWMWDRATRRVTKIGGSHGPTDSPFPSAWADPVVGAGHATWIEGVDASGLSHVQVVDLLTGSVWTASAGHPTPGAVVGNALVWSESPAPGAPNVARAVDLTSRHPVTPPAALTHEEGLFSLASDGTALSWIVQSDPSAGAGTTTSSVRYATSGTSTPRTAFELTTGGFNPPLSVRGPVVVGTYTEGSFIANGADGSASTITGIFGIQMHNGKVRVTQDPKGSKGTQTRQYVDVPVSDLLPGAC